MSYTVERVYITATETVKKEMKTLEDWQAIHFESSTGKTSEFMAFCLMFRARMKREAAAHGLALVNWSNGHFYCSAFFQSQETQKFVYLSISDVRHFRNEWSRDILIRTAKGIKDYTGGVNCSASLDNVGAKLKSLTV